MRFGPSCIMCGRLAHPSRRCCWNRVSSKAFQAIGNIGVARVEQSRRIVAAALPGAVLPACSAQPFMRAGIRSAAGRAAHTEYDSGACEDQWASSASTLAIGSNSAPILVSRPASPPVSRIWPSARVVSPSTRYVSRTLSRYEAW